MKPAASSPEDDLGAGSRNAQAIVPVGLVDGVFMVELPA